MTDASMKIASDSKELTARSKEIAEKTMLDGSAMKTIAIVTMIFLPGTAIAVRVSQKQHTSPFTDTPADDLKHGFLLRRQFGRNHCRLHTILDLLDPHHTRHDRRSRVMVVPPIETGARNKAIGDPARKRVVAW